MPQHKSVEADRPSRTRSPVNPNTSVTSNHADLSSWNPEVLLDPVIGV